MFIYLWYLSDYLFVSRILNFSGWILQKEIAAGAKIHRTSCYVCGLHILKFKEKISEKVCKAYFLYFGFLNCLTLSNEVAVNIQQVISPMLIKYTAFSVISLWMIYILQENIKSNLRTRTNRTLHNFKYFNQTLSTLYIIK